MLLESDEHTYTCAHTHKDRQNKKQTDTGMSMVLGLAIFIPLSDTLINFIISEWAE